MTDIYVGEYGPAKRLIVGTGGYDISSATLVLIKFSASAGTYSATCSVLGANYTASSETFSANKAVEWVPVSAGIFSAQADPNYKGWIEVTFGASKLISDSFKFSVSNPGD